MVKITSQVLWLLILSLKGFIPSVLKPNHTFLGSFSVLLIKPLPLTTISRVCNLIIIHLALIIPPCHECGFFRVKEDTSQAVGHWLEVFSALHRCLMECPLGAEILVPPFLYPSYSSFSPWRLRPHRKGHCSCIGWPHTGDIYPLT